MTNNQQNDKTPTDNTHVNTQKSHKKKTNILSAQSIEEICNEDRFIINPMQANNLYEYLYLLQKWNQSMNLVGKHTWQAILQELIMDSLHLARFLFETNPLSQKNNLEHPAYNIKNIFTMPDSNDLSNEHLNAHNDVQQAPYPQISTKNTSTSLTFQNINTNALTSDDSRRHALSHRKTQTTPQIWDLGAGAGLPGIPLRIFWSYGDYHLIESREKRCLFLSTVLAKLSLPCTHVYRGRAENFIKDKTAQLIISRAFMPYEKMLNFVAPHIQSVNGKIIFLTLKPLDASIYNNKEYSFNTTHVYEYTIKSQTRFLCTVAYA